MLIFSPELANFIVAKNSILWNIIYYFNPCTANLLVRIFHSFEAGIADAIDISQIELFD